MKGSSYHERDYTFGQVMLTLRTAIGLTQAGLAWSPTGEVLLSDGSDGSLRWWDTKSRECLRVLKGHQGTVHSLKVSPDGKTVASSGDDNAIQLWALNSGEHLQTLRRDRPYERLDISGVKGVTEAQKATLRALGAIERTSAPGFQQAP
jgi:WD40 repeat protein